MAVGFDVATESHTGTTGNSGAASFTWNHTGGGSARAALVFVFSIGALTDTSVTYGGTSMTAVPYTGTDTDTEPGAVRAYFLDNCGTGTKAVVVNRTNNAVVMYAVCFTVTAATATEVYLPGVKTAGGSAANTAASSSATGTGTLALLSIDDGSPGSSSLRFMGRYQGTSNVTAAGTGSTAGPSIDFGLFVIDTFRETTASQGASNVGGATITDDVAAIALAVRELAITNAAAGNAAGTGASPDSHIYPLWGDWSSTYSNSVASGTNADAGLASGTGSAVAVAVTEAPATALVTGTGAAASAGASVRPGASLASGTGAVAVAAGSVKPGSGVATGTGAAQNAAPTAATVTNAPAGLASGTGAVGTATVTTWGDWSSTYSNTVAASATDANAGLASGVGAANNATRDVVWGDWSTTYSNSVSAVVSTGGGRRWPLEMTWRESRTDVVAGCATGTGSARNPTIAIERDDDLVFILAA